MFFFGIAMKYTSSKHAKFLIAYHIIFVVKYRQPLLKHLGDWMKNTFLDIAKKSDFSISTMEVDIDHLHLMVLSPPNISPTQIVRRLKQQSTYLIWITFPSLQKYFWKEKTFWSV